MADTNAQQGDQQNTPPAEPPKPAAQQATPPAAPPAPPPPGVKDSEPKPGEEPNWLTTRTERAAEKARTDLLAQLGVTDPEQAKAAIKAAADAAEANKTAEQRAAEEAEARKAAQSKVDRQHSILVEQAARMMAVLKPEQQEAVKKLAQDDPMQQLNAIAALAPTWSAAEAAQQQADQSAQPPVNTAPASNNAPPSADPNSPPDHQANYRQLQGENPFKAAVYGQAHMREVFPSDK